VARPLPCSRVMRSPASRTALTPRRDGNSFEPTVFRERPPLAFEGMMAVRDAVRLVFRTQLEDGALL
jgi:hypothetical protein